jgi:transposase
MYIESVPNRTSPPAVLLREGWREGKKVRKRTLANLTHWPHEKIEALRRLLKGEKMVSAGEAFAIERSLPHGHVAALLAMARGIGLEGLIAAKRCRERDLVMAMILERLIHPCSKLATTRMWHATTLAGELGVAGCDEEDLYGAMDWLLARQARIEAKLARRHLSEGAPVFYDVTSSYYEGRTCPLMRFGYNRDGKKGKTQVVYGALCAEGGLPLAVSVYPGNTGDAATVPDQVERLRQRFGLERVVLVGDRGMLTQTRIDRLRAHPGIGWISALRSGAIRGLVEQGSLQPSLFDERDLAEISDPAYPGERLVACFNPLLAEQRARKRTELLAATETALEKIARQVARRVKTPLGAAEIGQKVGRVIARFKMAKHFETSIAEGAFSYHRKAQAIAAEAELDGIYVIRTSEPRDRLSPGDAVRTYKSLAEVERVFRTLKGVEILVRPIRHRDERRVRAHIFLCLLTYYLEWHLRKAWAALLFDDESLDRDRKTRDPVAPARPSPGARRKKTRRQSSGGLAIHSFETLIAELATQSRNSCRLKTDPEAPAFQQITMPTPLQSRAFQLIDAFPGPGNVKP